MTLPESVPVTQNKENKMDSICKKIKLTVFQSAKWSIIFQTASQTTTTTQMNTTGSISSYKSLSGGKPGNPLEMAYVRVCAQT